MRTAKKHATYCKAVSWAFTQNLLEQKHVVGLAGRNFNLFVPILRHLWITTYIPMLLPEMFVCTWCFPRGTPMGELMPQVF